MYIYFSILRPKLFTMQPWFAHDWDHTLRCASRAANYNPELPGSQAKSLHLSGPNHPGWEEREAKSYSRRLDAETNVKATLRAAKTGFIQHPPSQAFHHAAVICSWLGPHTSVCIPGCKLQPWTTWLASQKSPPQWSQPSQYQSPQVRQLAKLPESIPKRGEGG